MKLDSLLPLLLPEEKQTYEILCKQATSSKPNRGEISQRFEALWKVVLKRVGEKRHPGPLIGQFWKKMGGGKKKKSNKKETPIDLLRLSEELPYPLGYKVREFSLEYEKFSQGVGSSNFPYLVASLNGLALRFLAIFAVMEYVLVCGAPDAKLNRLLAEGLRMPSDGTWKSMIDGLCGMGFEEELVVLPMLAAALKERHPFVGKKKGLSAGTALQELVRFRNQLLHGTHRFSEEEIHIASEKVKLIYKALSFLREFHLQVPQPGGVFDCTGTMPEWVGDGDKRTHWFDSFCREQNEEPKHRFGSPMILKEQTREEGKSQIWALSLHPLLHFAKRKEQSEELDELFFFNGWHDEQLEFISYRYARSQDHRQLNLPYHRFLMFFRKIPVTLLPQKSKLDFSGVAEFHLEHFVGRKEVLRSIETFLVERPKPYGVIKALAGMGKTALMAVWYDRYCKQRDWPSSILPIWHFCASVEGRNHPVVFLRSVLAQMDEFLGELPNEYPTSLDLLRRQFRKRLQKVRGTLEKGKRLVLFVDALDESLHAGGGNLSIPGILPTASNLPEEFSVLVSYRVGENGRNERVEQQLALPKAMVYVVPGCDPLRGLSWEEMQGMVLDSSERSAVPHATLQAIWSTAKQTNLSGEETADPFVLRFISDGLREGTVDPERSESVPQSLDALFDLFWNRLPVDHDYFLHRLLGMLSVMPELGNDELFARVFNHRSGREYRARHVTPDDIAERRSSINKFLMFSGDSYRLFHERFQDYVRRRFRPRDEALQLHLPLFRFCLSEEGNRDPYDLRFRVYHLAKLALHPGCQPQEREMYRERLWSLLLGEDFLAEKFAVFQRTDLILEDFSTSFPVFAPEPKTHPKEVWTRLAQTLQLSVHSNFVISHAIQESRRRLVEFAQRGELEQVLRIVLWGGTAYRRLLHLLLGAVWMKEAGHDPSRLFHALGDLGTPEVKASDLPFLSHLLRQADAPDGIFTQIQRWTESENVGGST